MTLTEMQIMIAVLYYTMILAVGLYLFDDVKAAKIQTTRNWLCKLNNALTQAMTMKLGRMVRGLHNNLTDLKINQTPGLENLERPK